MSRWVYPKDEWERKIDAAQRALKKEKTTRERRVKRWLEKFDKEYAFHLKNWPKESETEAEVWSTIGQWDEADVPELARESLSYAEFYKKIMDRAYVCVGLIK